GMFNIGDGLLPTDLDGQALPPPGTPNFFVGSMDNGGPYGAPMDALTMWEFDVDFVTPPNSTFTLAHTLSVAAFDSIYPCTPTSRACIPQPATANKIDILSYRQRPIHRLAYRNFGTHESLVTNQSVEAAANVAGTRWYEIRDPNGSPPVIYQQGTYAPGTVDGIHRWMGSIAMDRVGNMALGYSASDGISTFPSVWYTGRLVTDTLGTMPQGEESIHDGTGSQTGSNRWGDYTSMNVDSVDDCTFWYVNEYLPVTSGNGWRLRIGAFTFPGCAIPDFTLSADAYTQQICAGDDAVYDLDVGSLLGYSDSVTLSASLNPAGTTTNFSVNPVTPPGSSQLTVGNTGSLAAGTYSVQVTGTAPTSTHALGLGLSVTTAPGAPNLISPANGATNVSVTPALTWSAVGGATSYDLEIATDVAFTNVVYTATVNSTSHTVGSPLDTGTTHYWHVRSNNACGGGNYSTAFNFTTIAAPDAGVSPTSLSSTQAPNTSVSQPLTISNNGGQSLSWNLTESVDECATTAAIPWLSANPTSGNVAGGANTSSNVTFDSTGQTPGVYTGTLCLNSNDPGDPTIPVPVTLTVELNALYLPVIIRPAAAAPPSGNGLASQTGLLLPAVALLLLPLWARRRQPTR
ncbi:MAG: hypothetical protein L0346_03955, partial [Chloroflexi bacterium]|nr:hypothetical protein [Chloroflexota bacterium]